MTTPPTWAPEYIAPGNLDGLRPVQGLRVQAEHVAELDALATALGIPLALGGIYRRAEAARYALEVGLAALA